MKILVLGSGQLARMMFLAGVPLGIDVQAVDVSTLQVVDPVSKHSLKLPIEEAIEQANVITVEFEHIPEDLLILCHDSGKLLPGIQAILAGADRVREKRLLTELQIANCAHQIIDQVEQLDFCIEQLGLPLVIKASRDGYDGYGQWRLTNEKDLPSLKAHLAKLDLQQVPLVVETMIQFDRELSLVGARDSKGEFGFYSLVQNDHFQGQLHLTHAPAADCSERLQSQAEDIFKKMAEKLNYVGVLAIEFFQVKDQLLVNEIAPRVHNSGHWTQQGADTCQFENHLRAVIGLPLGSTRHNGFTAMVNIIGVSSFKRDLLGINGCHLHWYGKTAHEKRKMGHLNLHANSSQEITQAINQLKHYLPLEYFPLL